MLGKMFGGGSDSAFSRTFVEICTESRLDIDPESMKRIESEFSTRLEGDRRVVLMILGGIAAMIASGWIVGLSLVWVVGWLSGDRTASLVIAGTVTPLFLIGLWFLIFPRMLRRTMRRTLRECGFDICVPCGYNLSATPPEKPCPECGRMRSSPVSERGEV